MLDAGNTASVRQHRQCSHTRLPEVRIPSWRRPYATASSPFFWTKCSSLRAVPVGRFWPISHF